MAITKNKVNTVVALAMAKKIHAELNKLVKEALEKKKKKIEEDVLKDNLTIEFNEALSKAKSLHLKLIRKYYDENVEVFYDFNKEDISNYLNLSIWRTKAQRDIPSPDEIRDDIILKQASTDDFNADKLISKLIEQYREKLKI